MDFSYNYLKIEFEFPSIIILIRRINFEFFDYKFLS